MGLLNLGPSPSWKASPRFNASGIVKISENKIYPTVSAYLNVMLEGVWAATPPHFITSATTSKGKEEVVGICWNRCFNFPF